jgi:PiT family inorganic phosphate transporter
MLSLLGGVFLGWSLGTNDAANVIGSAVSARMLRFGTAVLLAAAFVLLGALLGGQSGLATYSGLTDMTLVDAVTASVGAALTVSLLSLFGLPVSTSQAVVGALLGVGLFRGMRTVRPRMLFNIALGWLFTPALGCALTLGVHLLRHLRYLP